MIFNKHHFPFLLLLFILFSCKNEKKEQRSFYKNDFNKLIELGQQSAVKQQFDSAFYYYNSAKETCKEYEADKIIYVLAEMAKVQRFQADFIGAEETATAAFPYLKDCKDPRYIYSLYSVLAITYKELYDYENAIKYNNKCLNGSLQATDAITIKNNLAVVYLDQKEFQKSLKILSQLYKNEALKLDKSLSAKVIDNLGYTYFKLNNQSALNFLKEGLKIRDSIKNDFEKIPSLMHLSEYYVSRDSKLANEYALKAYQASTTINNPDDRLDALDFLIKNSSENEFKKYYALHSSLRDSLLNVRQTAKNQFAKIKYDSTTALQDSENQKKQKQLYFILLLFSIAIALFIFFLIRSRNKRKLLRETYNTEIRISKRIHDELANDVYNTMTFAETQDLQNTAKRETLIDNLDAIYARTRDISRENSEIETQGNYQEFLKDMLSSYSSNDISVIVNKINTVEWISVKTESKTALYRVLQELMINMKKHSQSQRVIIGFENHKKHVEINYTDDGIGFTEKLKLKNGLQNAENRIIAIKGRITFETETNKGFKVKIMLPK